MRPEKSVAVLFTLLALTSAQAWCPFLVNKNNEVVQVCNPSTSSSTLSARDCQKVEIADAQYGIKNFKEEEFCHKTKQSGFSDSDGDCVLLPFGRNLDTGLDKMLFVCPDKGYCGFSAASGSIYGSTNAIVDVSGAPQGTVCVFKATTDYNIGRSL